MIDYLKKILEWIGGSLNSNDLVQMGKVVLILCTISWCLTTLFLWVIFKAILAWGFIVGAFLFWLALFAGNLFRKYLLPASVAYVRNKLWPEPPPNEASATSLRTKI
jgi:hypothetical protein